MTVIVEFVDGPLKGQRIEELPSPRMPVTHALQESEDKIATMRMRYNSLLIDYGLVDEKHLYYWDMCKRVHGTVVEYWKHYSSDDQVVLEMLARIAREGVASVW